MPDYSQGKIYKMTCETGKVYIGSTSTPLKERLSRHKRIHNHCVTKDFINPKIELIESYPCETKEQLLWREREWFEKTECVNKNKPIITDEERKISKKKYLKIWRDDNKLYHITYRQENKERLNETAKEKIQCVCGIIVSKSHKARHLKSKKHQAFVSSVKINL